MTAHRVSLLAFLLLLAGCVEQPASQPEPPAPTPVPPPAPPQLVTDPQLADAVNRLLDATARQEREIAELRERISQPDPKPPQGPPEKSRRLILFTADWCGPCQPLKARLVPALRAAGWLVGDTPDCDLQIADVDKTANRSLLQRFEVRSLPMIVITREDGQYLRNEAPQNETPASLDADRKRFWQ